MDTELLARQRVALVLDKISEQDQRPDAIVLSDFDGEATFNFLMPGGWTFSEWQALNKKVARELRDHGLKVTFAPVRLNEFFDFLARYGLKDTPQNRAQFITWLTAPEPKPEPQPD